MKRALIIGITGQDGAYSPPYKFKGKRYDAGDKAGYVKAIIDFALERGDLKDDVKRYLE
jgi:UTP-glucose-1-phosphate uridylyltransferase